jgi:hypothetical protein
VGLAQEAAPAPLLNAEIACFQKEVAKMNPKDHRLFNLRLQM